MRSSAFVSKWCPWAAVKTLTPETEGWQNFADVRSAMCSWRTSIVLAFSCEGFGVCVQTGHLHPSRELFVAIIHVIGLLQ